MKSKIGHFCNFDCLVYFHIPTKRRKLTPLGEKGIFVSYSQLSKAYRVFIPLQKKVVVHWDVKFEEGLEFRKSHDPIPVTKDKERHAPKIEESSSPPIAGTQPLVVNLVAQGQIASFGQPSSSRKTPPSPWKNLIWPWKNVIFLWKTHKDTIVQVDLDKEKAPPESHINTSQGNLIWTSSHTSSSL